MAITNGYATLAELRTRLGVSDTADDTTIEAVIESASWAIDAYADWIFYALSETRYFDGDDPICLFVGDLLSVTTLKTDDVGLRTYGTTWATTDYDLLPYNTTPKTRISITQYGRYSFPVGAKSVEIVGSWGHNATGSYPDDINEACLLWAARLFARKNAPFGVAGSPDNAMMTLPGVDPDVKRLLSRYIKYGAM